MQLKIAKPLNPRENERTLLLGLEIDDDGDVALTVRFEDEQEASDLLMITEDLKIVKISGVNPAFGFKLENEMIVIAEN